MSRSERELDDVAVATQAQADESIDSMLSWIRNTRGAGAKDPVLLDVVAKQVAQRAEQGGPAPAYVAAAALLRLARLEGDGSA